MAMKKLIFLFMLILIPVFFAYSQDDKSNPQRDAKLTKIILKEVTCKDCQGAGWIYAIDYFSNSVPKTSFVLALNPGASRPSSIAVQKKMICPYCGGKKTVFIELKVY